MPINTSPRLAFRCLCMVEGNVEISHKNSFGNGKNGRVCNIFQQPFSVGFGLPNAVVNGLRMASEATTPCLVLKYCKIGKRGFSRAFRPEKRKHRTSLPQTTDVSLQKYGCLCPRSPMFLNQKHGIFQTFCRIF